MASCRDAVIPISKIDAFADWAASRIFCTGTAPPSIVGSRVGDFLPLHRLAVDPEDAVAHPSVAGKPDEAFDVVVELSSAA